MDQQKRRKNHSARERAEMAQVATEVLEDPDFSKKLSAKARQRLLAVSKEDLSNAAALSDSTT